uniref:Uncharacterized protein n=1 Tax=Lygus hesperus TaxID=30085 RepID=A0A146M4B8_LYGHE
MRGCVHRFHSKGPQGVTNRRYQAALRTLHQLCMHVDTVGTADGEVWPPPHTKRTMFTILPCSIKHTGTCFHQFISITHTKWYWSHVRDGKVGCSSAPWMISQNLQYWGTLAQQPTPPTVSTHAAHSTTDAVGWSSGGGDDVGVEIFMPWDTPVSQLYTYLQDTVTPMHTQIQIGVRNYAQHGSTVDKYFALQYFCNCVDQTSWRIKHFGLQHTLQHCYQHFQHNAPDQRQFLLQLAQSTACASQLTSVDRHDSYCTNFCRSE